MKKLIVSFALSLLFAANMMAQNVPTAKQVIDNYVTALGGKIKFSKEKLLSVGSTKWEYDKIKEISKEEYDLFLEGKQKKQNIADFKSNILRSIQNDNFFRSINSDDLLKLNTLIEELKIKNKVS